MDIRCRKTRCRFNNCYTCKAKEIGVTKKVICGSFEKDPDKPEIDTTKHLFEEPPKYSPQRDSKTAIITCEAPCLFNKGGKCVSNGITVNAIKEKPYCVSFLEK